MDSVSRNTDAKQVKTMTLPLYKNFWKGLMEERYLEVRNLIDQYAPNEYTKKIKLILLLDEKFNG